MNKWTILAMVSVSWSSVFLAAFMQAKVKYATSEHQAMQFIKRTAIWVLLGTFAIAQLYLAWWLWTELSVDKPVTTHRLAWILLSSFSIFFTFIFIVIDKVYGGPLAEVAGVMRVLVEDFARKASQSLKKKDDA